jgi:2'-5' RNA ligase superfamily protein
MALAVVNYPAIRRDDLDWIQSIRREHDHLFFGVVDPHLTIVFPTDGVAQSTLVEHVAERVSVFHSFEVVFRCAILGDPDFMGHAHAFLTPDEGFSEIVRLHDGLYTGPLAGELRLDLPFIPHVGIASTPSLEECKAIVDRLNKERFEIRGQVDALDVIGYDGTRVWNIERYALHRGSA